jgi:hypothetical protein
MQALHTKKELGRGMTRLTPLYLNISKFFHDGGREALAALGIARSEGLLMVVVHVVQRDPRCQQSQHAMPATRFMPLTARFDSRESNRLPLVLPSLLQI